MESAGRCFDTWVDPAFHREDETLEPYQPTRTNIMTQNCSQAEWESTASIYGKALALKNACSSWPNGPPNSSQLEPSSQLRWSWVSFGHPLGLSWLELAWIWSSSKFRPTRAKFSTVWSPQANSRQLSPSCFVIVMWLRGRIQTRQLNGFLRTGSSWIEMGVPFGQGFTAPFNHARLNRIRAWVGLARARCSPKNPREAWGVRNETSNVSNIGL